MLVVLPERAGGNLFCNIGYIQALVEVMPIHRLRHTVKRVVAIIGMHRPTYLNHRSLLLQGGPERCQAGAAGVLSLAGRLLLQFVMQVGP